MMGTDVIKINDKELEIKEWKSKRVVTAKDIADLHERDVKRVVENFQNNKEKFEFGKDYFEITKEEIRKSKFSESFSKYSKNSIEILYTERGYLKLTKTFNDDLSWKIQDLLVESYFVVKDNLDKIELPKTYLEALKELVIKEEEKQKLLKENEQKQKVIEYQKPKVEYTDNVLKSDTLINISQIAKDFNLSGTKLNRILCENKIQYKQGKQYNLYQKYMNMDLAKSYTYLDTNGSSHMCLKWTEKGRKFIYELLKELGYIYEEE